MHTKEELDRAILSLYKDYKYTIKDYKDGNLKFLYDVNKINNEEKKYKYFCKGTVIFDGALFLFFMFYYQK